MLGVEDLQGGEVRDPGVFPDLKEKVMAVAVRTIDEAPAGAAACRTVQGIGADQDPRILTRRATMFPMC